MNFYELLLLEPFLYIFDSFTRSLRSSGMDSLTDFKVFTAIFPTFRNFLVLDLVGLWSTLFPLNTMFVSCSPWQFLSSFCKPVGFGWYGTVHIRHRQFGFPQPTILSVGKFWFRPILDPSSLAMSFKVHIFWEGHKILRNFHQLFDWQYIGQIIGGDLPNFVAFSEYINFIRFHSFNLIFLWKYSLFRK